MTPKRPARQRKLPPASSFQRIADDLRDQVRRGQLSQGALLPGQRTLAGTYGVSAGTVQQAVALLLAEGTLRTEGGRGTFVAAQTAPPDTRSVRNRAASRGSGTSAADALPAAPLTSATRAAAPVILGIIALLNTDSPETSAYSAWEQKLVHVLERTLSEEGGAHVQFLNLAGEAVTPLATAIRSLEEDGVDALAIVSPTRTMNRSDIESLCAAVRATRLPIIVVSHQDFSEPIANVSYDSRIAGYQAAAHLIRNGYRRLVFLTPVSAVWVEQRLAGVRDAVHAAGLSADSLRLCPESGQLVASPAISFRGLAYEATKSLATGDLKGTGVIAANDGVAYGVLRAAEEAGLEAGRDFGLVGFDDEPASRTLGLTSLHPPLEAMGREAARLLLRALQEDDLPLTMHLRLRSHLIARDSSRPLPH